MWTLLLSFATQLPFWLVAVLFQTDKLTDLSFALGIATVSYVTPIASPHAHLMRLMIFSWAVRLGAYLFYRVHTIGRDARFDKMRSNPLRFSRFWVLQSVSIYLMTLFLTVDPASTGLMMTPWATSATVLFFAGLALEAMADAHKFSVKLSAPQTLCQSGWFSWVRHPNYTGEIMVWWALFLLHPSAVGLISPCTITLLLAKVSGIPILERMHRAKYGVEYERYVKRVPYRLFPYVY
jgi:steroid 5-alpha reductase family enzyme